MSGILKNCPKTNAMEHLPTEKVKVLWFSLANFKNKLVILTGGFSKNVSVDLTRALQVSSGKWISQNNGPSCNTLRHAHGSCIVGDSVYLIGGWENSQMVNTIESLKLNLSGDLTSAFDGSTWNQITVDNLDWRAMLFVCTLNHN